MSNRKPVDIEEIREPVLSCLRDCVQSGNTSVRSRQIAEKIDVKSQPVGLILRRLESEGVVNQWNSTYPARWQIIEEELLPENHE